MNKFFTGAELKQMRALAKRLNLNTDYFGRSVVIHEHTLEHCMHDIRSDLWVDSGDDDKNTVAGLLDKYWKKLIDVTISSLTTELEEIDDTIMEEATKQAALIFIIAVEEMGLLPLLDMSRDEALKALVVE